MIEPFEVSYTTSASGKKMRNVIGVLCPTVLAQALWQTAPIFISLGDVAVDWNAPQSEGLRTILAQSTQSTQ